METIELIVYACPVNILGEQLDAFFRRSRNEIGINTAHGYMPHCTLTGFFHDTAASVPFYVDALERAHGEMIGSRPEPPIIIESMEFGDEFHFLKLESVWTQSVISRFAELAHSSPTRTDTIRRKDWLHLSLAYGFASDQREPLQNMAKESVDITAPVDWEIRFYRRDKPDSWTLLWGKPL